MRVTHSMMIHNMSYWVSKQSETLNDALTVVGAGKKINKPSDDPVAIGQVMSDRVKISQYGQYESNITQANLWVNASNTLLEAVSATLQNAINAVSTYSAGGTDKTTSLMMLKNYYTEMIALADSSYASSYMYSGNLSNTRPFVDEVSIQGGLPSDIIFDLAGNAGNVGIQISNEDGTVVRNITGLSGAAGTNTMVWDGLDDSSNPLPDGTYQFVVTAQDGTEAVAAYPTYRGDAGGKEIIIGSDEKIILNNNGGIIFSSLLRDMSRAITAITNDSGNLSSIGDSLLQNNATIETQIVQLSNAVLQLDNSNNRLQTLMTNSSNRISNLETGSVEEAAIKVKAQQIVYEEVISLTADILKMPKLTDYL